MTKNKRKIKIAFVSTYPPTRCGIATFAHTLAMNLRLNSEIEKIYIFKVEHVKKQKAKKIKFAIQHDLRSDYEKAAEKINKLNVDLIIIQHEYGIYGGLFGEYILTLTDNLKKPFMLCLHSVLREHPSKRFILTLKLLKRSRAVVVMTKNAKNSLVETFNIPPSKITVIPHGVPETKLSEKHVIKNYLKLKKNIVVSTFGLIGKGKGIEIGIKTINKLKTKYPEILYFILGATHPQLLKKEGEAYRNKLIKMVDDFHLQKNVIFINSFLKQAELIDFLKATDIYIAPQKDLRQAFSGTVAYSMSCGCAVISSPTPYAKEVLSQKRGFVMPPLADNFRDKIHDLIKNPKLLGEAQRKAYFFSKRNQWPKIAKVYLKLMIKVIENEQLKDEEKSAFPDLKHFFKISDQFGVIQHCIYSKPNFKFGYSLDDQARALIVCLKLQEQINSLKIKKMINIFFNFLRKAIDQKGVVHNFFDYNRNHIDQYGSPESLARSFWALSMMENSPFISLSIKKEIRRLREKYKSDEIHGPQALAYELLGYVEQKKYRKIKKLSGILLKLFKKNSNKNWLWFDNKMTWSNGIIPYALLKAFRELNDTKIWKTIERSLAFLEKHCEDKTGCPVPVGQNGWFYKNKKKALFDQQPLEASSMVLLYNELYDLTGKPIYLNKARSWMDWYYGNNILGANVYNPKTAGVYDGLHPHGVNKNQGAESIITFLLARLSFKKEK